MRQINIYVEGKGDLIFVSHFLSKHFELLFNYDFVKLNSSCQTQSYTITIRTFFPDSGRGGINSNALRNLVSNITQADIPLGVEPVIILDSDTSQHQNPIGGFGGRRLYLDKVFAGTNIKYFLIPNHSEDGNLEVLLEKLISRKGEAFYTCLCSYVNCLQKITADVPKGIQEIDCFDKIRLEWYTYIMLGRNGSSNKKSRDYLSTDLWDLDSVYLNPLKAFFNALIAE